MKETIIWTALPNGRSGGKLQMSAHVTFHLSYTTQELAQARGKAKVSNFPTVSAFKPESIAIKVLFNGKPVEAKVISKPEPGLFAKLFPADGPVTSYDPVKPVWQEVRTFSTFDIYKHIEGMHADFIIASFEPPRSFSEMKSNALLSQMAPRTDLIEMRSRTTQTAKGASKDPHVQLRGMMQADTSHPAMKTIMESRRLGQQVKNLTMSDAMVEAVHFHRPFLSTTGDWPLPTRPETDFHDAYSMLCQHPQLMRTVGVVFDFEISSLPAGEGVLSVQVEGMPAASTRFPGTACIVSSTGFMAKERTSVSGSGTFDGEITQGFMKMHPENVALGAMDLSGAVLQTASFVEHTTIQASKPSIRIGEKMSTRSKSTGGRPAPIRSADSGSDSVDDSSAQLPTRRTAGITVYRRDQSIVHFDRDNLGQVILNSKFAEILHADDLHKGWRPDVQHKGKWFSLTARSVFYKIADKAFPTDVSDEGHVSSSDTSSPDGKIVKIPESMMTWDGWSLSAPKPVSPLVDRSIQDDSMPNTSAISSIAEARAHNYTVNETDKHYRLNYFAEPAKGSLPTLRYGEVYVFRSRSVDLAGNSLPLSATQPTGTTQTITYLRHEPILPPSLHLHESAGPGESAYVVAVRKSADGKVSSKSLRFMYPPVGGMNHAELHGKFDLPSGAPDPSFYAKVLAIDNRKDLPDVITSVNAPPIPYLIDPACVGAAIKRTGRASKATDVATTGFLPGTSWYDAQASTLSVVAGTAPKIEGSTGVQGLNLTLAPGQDITFLISSTTTEEYLPLFEQSRWIEKALQVKGDSLVKVARNPKFAQRMEAHRMHKPFNFEPTIQRPIAIRVVREAQPESSAQKALDACLRGQNAALTPTRSVRAVYAVQVPEPGFAFEKIEVTRDPGTTAQFEMQGQVHGWSTEELEVTLNYTDPVDDISEPRRKTESAVHNAKVFDDKLFYVDTVPINGWYETEDIEFHDTKCHFVQVVAVTKTRYADFFPGATAPGGKKPEPRTEPGKIKIIQPKTDAPADGIIGDYTRTYSKSGIIVPSSKRPDKPEVEYILPSMAWSSETTPTGKVSRKRGNSVRIFLRRPWFSSGVGEQLAVVLSDGSDTHSSDPDYQLNSTIGFDPAFEVLDQPLSLKPENFKGNSGVKQSVAIQETGKTATLVTYYPEFDESLQLWYVDVEIDPPAAYYTPFLRLVVCRYQANTAKGINPVSALAATEITQLQPDRVAVVHTVEARKAYQVYYAGIPGRSAKNENMVIGTLEIQANNGPDSPWLPVMKDNDPFEFLVFNHSQDSGAISGESNIYEWASHAENIARLTGGRPPMIITLPPTPGEYRVVLREYEIHPSLLGDPPVAMSNPGIAGRLVHADVVYLTTNGPAVRGGRDQA